MNRMHLVSTNGFIGPLTGKGVCAKGVCASEVEEYTMGHAEAIGTISHPEIAERAYQIYEFEGRPDGRALDHWLRAETLLAAERGNSVARQIAVWDVLPTMGPLLRLAAAHPEYQLRLPPPDAQGALDIRATRSRSRRTAGILATR
jgi:hypothetical protein